MRSTPRKIRCAFPGRLLAVPALLCLLTAPGSAFCQTILVAPDPETLFHGGAALIPQDPDSLGLAGWETRWKNAQLAFNEQTWRDHLEQQSLDAFAREDLRDVLLSLINLYETRDEVVAALRGKAGNKPEQLRTLARNVAELGWQRIAADLYGLAGDGSEAGIRSLIARAALLEESGERALAVKTLESPELALTRRGNETARELRERAAVALTGFYLELGRPADAAVKAGEIPEKSPWWGQAQLLLACALRLNGRNADALRVAASLQQSTDRIDLQLGAGCENFAASGSDTTAVQEGANLASETTGLDTLQACSRQAVRAQNGLIYLELIQKSALADSDSATWLRAEKVRQGLVSLYRDAWAEAVDGPIAHRIISESRLIHYLNSQPVTDDREYIPVSERETRLLELLAQRRDLVNDLFLKGVDAVQADWGTGREKAAVGLLGTGREKMGDNPAREYLDELTEALRYRDQLIQQLTSFSPDSDAASPRLIAAKALEDARESKKENRDESQKSAIRAYWTASFLPTAPASLELQTELQESNPNPDPGARRLLWLKASEASRPEDGGDDLWRAGFAGIEEGRDRWGRAVALTLLGDREWACGSTNPVEWRRPYDLYAASLLAEPEANPGSLVDSLVVELVANPLLQRHCGVDLALSLGKNILDQRGPDPAIDSLLTLAHGLADDPYSLARINRLSYQLAEHRGSSSLEAWSRRMEAAQSGLATQQRPAWSSTVSGRRWHAQVTEEAYEALNLATQNGQGSRQQAWRQRAVESATLLETAAPDDPRAAVGWVNVAALYEERDTPDDWQQAVFHYLHSASRWPKAPSSTIASDRALVIADRLVKRTPVPVADSLLVEAARLRAGRLDDEEQIASTLLKAGVTLRKEEQWQPAVILFDDVFRRYPATEASDDALEGWLECELALGNLRMVWQMHDSLMAEGASGRRATMLRRALTRAETLLAKRLKEAGLEGEAATALEGAGGIDADPEVSAWAMFEAGRNAEERRNPEEAENAYKMVLDWYPEQEAAPSAAVSIARLHEERSNRRRHTPTDEEIREVAGLYERVATDYPESEQAPPALVHAAELYRKIDDKPGEQRSLTTLLIHYPHQEGVLPLGRRAGLLAWAAGDRSSAHKLFLTITERAPRSREAVSSFVYLGSDAVRNNKASDARWAFTMALRAQTAEEKAGRPGDAAFAHQASLALAELDLPAFRAIRYDQPGRDSEKRRTEKLNLGSELVKRYREAADYLDVASVRSLLGIAAVEVGMAGAEQFRELKKDQPAESLAVMTQKQALAAWGHRNAAIDALELARKQSIQIVHLADSLKKAKVSEEEVGVRTGLQADGLCNRTSGETETLTALSDSAAREIIRQYDLGIAAQEELLNAFATLPDRGTTKLERDVYRLALIDDLLRPRIRFLLELKIAARKAERELRRKPGFASDLFTVGNKQRSAADIANQVMETDLPVRLEAYRQEVAKAATTVIVEPLEEQGEKIIDMQQLAVDLSWLDVDLAREQLSVVVDDPDLKQVALDRARSAMKAAIQHALEMDRHARLNRQEAQQYRDRYETMRSEGLLDAVRLHEDLADGWGRGAIRVLESAWAIAGELGLRPSPEVDEVARQLARRDPANFAYTVGLKENQRTAITNGGWTWRPSEEGNERRVTIKRQAVSWSTSGNKQQPMLIAADPTAAEAWFEQTITIEGTLSSATLSIVASRRYEVYLNGRFAAETVDGRGVDGEPEEWNVTDLLQQGPNRIRVRLSGEGSESALALRLTWSTVGEIRDSMKAVFPNAGRTSK